ncbi:hypothetical protein [Natrarchaeobius oligotrophus]|uniref:hypothetical protein n=1 Tax=Natrarchaeobius oligotrophus TaxID=3455743 RepID=UPI000F534409|nr:hypothetical protein [Natrarchaeobius chitinivorans]
MNSYLVAFTAILAVVVLLLFLEKKEVLSIELPQWVLAPLLVSGIVGIGQFLAVPPPERALVTIAATLCFFIGVLWPLPREESKRRS